MSKILYERRDFLKAAAAVSLASVAGARAFGQEVLKLKFASISAPAHVINRVIHKNWIDTIHKETNGRVEITLFPGASLGAAKQSYDIAAGGVADISYGWITYYAGRFPISEVMTLPGIIPDIGAAYRSYDVFEKYLKPEWAGVKVLWLGVNPPYGIVSRDRPIRELADIKGMKIGTIGTVAADVVKRIGGTPIDLSAQNAYLALQRGVLDGYINPWSSTAANKLGEIAHYFTEAKLYSTVFFAVMNKKKYEALPADIRAVIDKNSGRAAFEFASKAYWDDDLIGKEQTLAQTGGKGQVFTFSASEQAKYRELMVPVWDTWRKTATGKGYPADDIIRTLSGR